ncbi:MAG: hypothetical protein ACXIUP_09675 [Microcella sp.]
MNTTRNARPNDENAPRENDDRTDPLGTPTPPDGGGEEPLGTDGGATDRDLGELGGGHE